MQLQDHLARLMFLTRVVKATVGFGAGVGAFKTALWQMGVFNTNQMREPVQQDGGRLFLTNESNDSAHMITFSF